jgi:hypothetical protein
MKYRVYDFLKNPFCVMIALSILLYGLSTVFLRYRIMILPPNKVVFYSFAIGYLLYGKYGWGKNPLKELAQHRLQHPLVVCGIVWLFSLILYYTLLWRAFIPSYPNGPFLIFWLSVLIEEIYSNFLWNKEQNDKFYFF